LVLSAVSAAWGQGGDFGGGTGEEGKALVVSAEFTAGSAAAPGRLFITAKVKQGWHIYSITQPPGGPLATTIKVQPPAGVRVGDFQVSPPPKKSKEVGFGDLVIETHQGTVTWYAPLELAAGIDPATLKIPGQLNVQACDPQSCYPPRDYPFTAVLGQGVAVGGVAPASPLAPAERQAAAESPRPAAGQPAAPPAGEDAGLAWQPFTTIAALGQLTAGGLDLGKIQQDVHQRFAAAAPLDIVWYVVAGFLGGLILNVMPCVLPVIGLKIMSFVEQSGHDRRRALVLNLWYSLGLMAVFFVLATLAVTIGLGWGQMFAKAGFSLTLAAVVFVMGLSFLGVWEIPIPGFAGRGKATELAAKEGAAGAFVKGALTTVLATPCTFPVLATALAWAIAQPPLLTYAVFLSIGLGMASPYLLIGAFPQLIRFLPKPGAWMDTFKQLMGFVLMGTVVWFLTFVALPLVAPTVGLLFGLWGACWWVGRLSPLADAAARGRTWLEAAAFAAVVWILMFTGISFPGVEPLGVPAFSFRGLAQVMRDRYDFEVRIAAIRVPVVHPAATAGPKTVMVDFTANWCPNCKFLEATILESPAVVEAVRRYGVVTLQADWSHEDPEVSKLLEALGCKQIPVLAIFPARDPNHPVVFLGGCWTQKLVDALKKAAGK
jgi:thiol:disulfide interchange protein DsbD